MHLTNEPEVVSESAVRNWRVLVSYDGTEFHGWQIQPGLPTIQGELQAALGRVTGEAPLPQGSGRTDAGVHALAQVASFPLTARIPAENLQRALNRTLPAAIRITSASIVNAEFHARHSTIAKTYEYRVFLERPEGAERSICPPFLARYVYAYPWPLHLPTLQTAAQLFVGTHDFLSFAATDPDLAIRNELGPGMDEEDVSGRRGSVRTIFSSQWHARKNDQGELYIFRVRGDGFLHHMVRNLVGTMLDVGRGYTPVEAIPGMLAARSRAAAGPTAPARGLFLHSVEYPE